MMTLHISEAEVRAVLTMPLAVEAVEEISRKQATGEVVVHPRRRFELPGGGFFHYMAAADFSLGFVAMKQYTYVRGKLRFLVPLYEMATGDLLARILALLRLLARAARQERSLKRSLRFENWNPRALMVAMRQSARDFVRRCPNGWAFQLDHAPPPRRRCAARTSSRPPRQPHSRS